MRLVLNALLIGCLCLLGLRPAAALDPTRSLLQFKHTRWTVDDGAPVNIISLAQGRDGYLWIGTIDGLVRFDGITFENISPERKIGDRTSITALLGARDGSVWAGYSSGGLAQYRNGLLRDSGMPHPDAYVISISQATDGGVWALLGRRDQPLVRYYGGHWQEIGESQGIPREWGMSLLTAKNGSVWLATLQSVLVLHKGAMRFQRVDVVPAEHPALSEDPAGRIWLSDKTGSRPITGSGPRITYPTGAPKRQTRALFDRDGNLWGRPETGIYRVRMANGLAERGVRSPADAVELFRAKDGLTGDDFGAIIEDREGNIWTTSSLGLDRFRPTRIAVEPNLTNRSTFGDVLLAASDGTVYVGEADAVYRILPGGPPKPLLRHTQDSEAMCEGPDRAIWIVLHDRLVKFSGGKLTAMKRPEVTQGWVHDCAIDRHNFLWLAASDAGMYRQTPDGWQHLMIPAVGGAGAVRTMLSRRSGGLEAILSPNRLSLFDAPHQRDIVFTASGWTTTSIKTFYPTSDGLLLGGKFGLALWRGSDTQLLSARRFPALAALTGIVQTPQGDTWTIGRSGIARFSTATLNDAFADPRRPVRAVLMDARDGFPGAYNPDGVRDVVRGGDGRLWFATYQGTVMIDPSRLPHNSLPPPVAISALKAQGLVHRDPTDLTLAAGTSDVEIGFATLSLSIPERVQVRYRLDGIERAWIDPGMRRQAFYTNLGPGHYVFRVIAANNDGVWNHNGASIAFDIPPTFLQSRWFMLLCLLGLGVLLWGVYRLRLRQLRAKMRDTLEERLAERERIARDLHDTLLQGFQGLILQFQSVVNAIPKDQRARQLLENALDSADDVMTDSRDSVQQLRAARVTDLACTFAELAERLQRDHSAKFELVVEGIARPLHPVVREEICRVGDEAITNAFRHAKATRIELAISYQTAALTLGIRDDGVGIAQNVLDSGRQGHFGLVGMRERAGQIKADFQVSSRPGAGTEIVVTVPGRVAFARTTRGNWRAFLQGLLDRVQ